MSKLHFIAVGGTGHKLLNSVIHLAACGAFKKNIGPNHIDTIRVLTVDADDANGNLSHTKNTLSAYQKFCNALSGSELGIVNIEQASPSLNLRLYHSNKDSISKTFNVEQYKGSDDDKLLRFLYTDDEVNTEFNMGFYGHTSIGTLIVKDILIADTIWKNDFLSGIADNDFVMVAGSIFGGTGASSIPVLLEELAAKRKEVKFQLAALMLTPYFKTLGAIQEKGVLQPDSSSFHIKAKAALYYYHDEKKFDIVDALYVIGEPETNFSNEVSSRGSSRQCNKAHPVELFAVGAVIDFIKDSKNHNAEFKIKTGNREIDDKGICCYTWKMVQNISQDLPFDMQRFMKAAVFYNKVIYGNLSTGIDSGVWQSYYDELHLKRDSNNNLVYENIYNYLRYFINWVYDLHKKNQQEIDPNTGKMCWEADARVRLFNAQTKELFDNSPVSDGIIKNFDDLIIDKNDGIPSEKVYYYINEKKPKGSGKDFAALFTVLYEIFSSPQKTKKTTAPQLNFSSIAYLSRENNATFQRPDPDANRFWSSSASTLLMNIADGLPMTVGDSFTRNDISIPSPWSVFIMNELTLTKEIFSGINRDSYNQWCAFITLLALRKLNHYETNGLKLEGPIKDSKGAFFNVVRNTCLPHSYLFNNYDWVMSSYVSLNNKIIAFLANNTIVCPAFSFDAITKTELNRIAPTIVDGNGNFLSPDNYFRDNSQTLNKDSKYALRLFLKSMEEILTKIAANNTGDVIRHLKGHVETFLKDIGDDGFVNNEISIPPDAMEKVYNVHDIFERLIPIANKRTIELPFELDGTINNERSVLIGYNIGGISSSGPQAANIFLTETTLYNQINPGKIIEMDGQFKDGVRLLYDDNLLCETMAVVKKDNAENGFYSLPNNYINMNYEIIWPVHEKLLSMFTTDDLNDMLSITSDNQNITVSLKLKLKNGFHIISKPYKILSSDTANGQNALNGICIIMEKNRLPFWAVWPFAKAMKNGVNQWKRYNFICVDRLYKGTAVMDIQPVFENQSYKANPPDRLSTISTSAFDVCYRRYTELPIAFKIFEKTKTMPVYRGAVFLKRPPEFEQGTNEWSIGLDFGTTSTTAFFSSQNESQPRFLQLLPEYKWVEGRNEPEEYPLENNNELQILADFGQRRFFDDYFIDKQTLMQNGYTTTYEILDETQDSSESTIFKSGRIFWHNYINFKNVNSDVEGRRERLRTNIKWDTDKTFVGKYLNQLMTQIAYMAVKNRVRKINWFFSYPTAFSFGDLGDFSERLEALTKNIEHDTGIASNYKPKENLLTESIAAAYYFRKKNPREQVFLCIDIGGGTSDVSIWIKTKYVFQSSIRFASRDMFITPLKRLLKGNVMEEVRTNIKSDNIYTMLDFKSNSTSDEMTKFFIETVLFEYYATLKQRLVSLQGENEAAYKEFKYSVFIAYSGLVYYIANIISELFNTNNAKKKIDNDITDIVFGLSGKGSKLTIWIDRFCDILYEEAQTLIKEKTKSDINPDGLSIRFRIQFEPETAKTETAIGIICDLDNGRQKNAVVPVDPDVFMGSNITVSKGSESRDYKTNDFVDTYNDQFFANPKELTISINRELQALDDFIAFFNKIAVRTKNDMQPVSADWLIKEKKPLWKKIETEFENLLDNGHFNPPFIVMLDVFLKEYFYE